MPAIPTVSITVQDQGVSAALSVPLSSIQLKIGVCVNAAAVGVPYATTSPTALQTQLIGGPLLEAGGLICQAGNVCLAIPCAIANKGTATAVTATSGNTSTSVVTTTVDTTFGAWDNYYVKVKVLTGGTVGTAGCIVAVSLDAGRNYGNPIALGTATSLGLGATLNTVVAGGTGVQVNFGGGSLVAGDSYTFSTVAPTWNQAGVDAALATFFASQYGIAGVGSIHIVGGGAGGLAAGGGGCSSSDLSNIQTNVQTGTTQYIYDRAIVELRDAGPPTVYGGSAETEATWITQLALLTSGATTEPRLCADGGFYNTPSPYANAAAGTPAYRRSLAWAHAVRRTQIPAQQRAGRVKDGPYGNIVVNPATDPTDGFVYHDERVTEGLNAARIASAMTWPKKGAGFFQCQEPLLSAPGSQFVELVIGNVLDDACDIVYAAGVEEVSDDLLCQANGTLDPIALNILQGDLQNPLNAGMVGVGLVSSVTATVSKTQNVVATGIIPVTVSVTPRGYVNSIQATVSLSNGGV